MREQAYLDDALRPQPWADWVGRGITRLEITPASGRDAAEAAADVPTPEDGAAVTGESIRRLPLPVPGERAAANLDGHRRRGRGVAIAMNRTRCFIVAASVLPSPYFRDAAFLSPSPRYSGERAGVRGLIFGQKMPPHPRPLPGVPGRGREKGCVPKYRNWGRRRGGGYVLVVALALLVLAASLMVGISRASLAHAARAREARDQLQRRWGEASCRQAVLPYADSILTTLEFRQKKPAMTYRARVTLAGQAFDLVLADEQAKANVNLLLEASDPPAVENHIRQALAGTGMGQGLKLRPAVSPTTRRSAAPTPQLGESPSRPPPPEWVGGFGQLFEGIAPERLTASLAGQPSAADLLTCWGDGSLNVRRISGPALKLMATPALSGADVGRLLEYRDSQFQSSPSIAAAPGLHPARAKDATLLILRSAGIDPTARPGMPALSGSSWCFSLWVVARTPRRDWYSLTVLDRSDSARPRTASFVW